MSMTMGKLKFLNELVVNATLATVLDKLKMVLDKLKSLCFQLLFVNALTSIGRPHGTYIDLITPMGVAHVLHTSQVPQTRLLASHRRSEICSRHPEFIEHGRCMR